MSHVVFYPYFAFYSYRISHFHTFILDLCFFGSVRDSLLYTIVGLITLIITSDIMLFGITLPIKKVFFIALYVQPAIPNLSTIFLSVLPFSSVIAPGYLKHFTLYIICT